MIVKMLSILSRRYQLWSLQQFRII